MHKILNGKPVELTKKEQAALQKEWDTNDAIAAKIAYSLARREQYKTIVDQLDQLWHAVDAGQNLADSDWYKDIKNIKLANPK